MSRRNRPPKAVREAALKIQREAMQDAYRAAMQKQAALDRKRAKAEHLKNERH